jgi:hypothetical protein
MTPLQCGILAVFAVLGFAWLRLMVDITRGKGK